MYNLGQGTFFTTSSVDFVEDLFPGKDMVDELKDFLVHEKKNSLRVEKTRMKRLITDLFVTKVMRKMKYLETKSLEWMVNAIKNMLLKVVMETTTVLIVNTLRRILAKKARNLKKRMHLI